MRGDLGQTKAFGKRGAVSMQARPARPLPGALSESAQDAQSGLLGFPKWAIGAVAAVLLTALVSTGGGFGSGGLLGGLIGGFLGHKLATRGTPAPATAPAAHSAPASSQSASQTTVARGGFGSSGRSFGFSLGG